MTTKTIDDVLAEVRRQIDDLEARADASVAETRDRLRHRIDVLREEEASARAAVRERAQTVDETVRRLEIDLAIAEDRFASETAADAAAFADAVEAELRDWDDAIERLQTRAATGSEKAREQAEAEVAALRHTRNEAAASLAALRASAQDAWHEHRNRVRNALEQLERLVHAAVANVERRRRA